MLQTLPIATEYGEFIARYSSEGLTELSFPLQKSPAANSPLHSVRDWHLVTTAAVHAILSGRSPNRVPPLDLGSHTSFRQKVWDQLRRIGLGHTLSYSQVAQQIGKPTATRAVGGACGANPIPLIIPCHRVLAAGNRLGGFSGGLDWKRRLLAVEGVAIAQSSEEAFEIGDEQQEFALRTG